MIGLDGDGGTGIFYGGVDLGAVSDDAGVGAESFAVGVVVCCNRWDVEVVECGAVSFAAVKDGAPGESCLCTFKDEQLEEGAVVVNGDAPVLVVVFLHEWVVASPFASSHWLWFHAMEAYYGVRYGCGLASLLTTD